MTLFTEEISSLKLLVVDDDYKKIETLIAMLDFPEYDLNITTATSGKEALKKAFDTKFDLILLDVKMPDMDGFDVAKTLGLRKINRNTSIIFVTSDTEEDADMFRGFELGAVDFITSPIIESKFKNKAKLFLGLAHLANHLSDSQEELKNIIQANKKQAEELERTKSDLTSHIEKLALEKSISISEKKTVLVLREFERVIDLATSPIFDLDTNGLVKQWNYSMEVVTKISKQKAIGAHWDAIISNHRSNDSIHQVLEDSIKGIPSHSTELIIEETLDGTVYLRMDSTPRFDSEGNVIGTTCICQNVTEQRNTQQQLIQSSKLASLGEMSTGVAHEIAQPLNVIKLVAGNILRKALGNEYTPEYIIKKMETIDIQVQRASSIIEHMRVFGRVAGEAPELICVQDGVHDSLILNNQLLAAEGIDLQLDLVDEPLMIRGNATQIEQVFINLIANAKDALQNIHGKKIRISCKKISSNAVLTFEDNGGGIPEIYTDRVFDPFFTTNETGKGTGLGLSVSHGIIKKFDGTFSCHNSDEGAVFTITLPLADD